MALTDTFVKNVKHTGAPAGDKHADGGGMYLLVNASGKYWRINYRFADKRKTLALGVYPDVSLAKARQRRDRARELLADDIDPSEAKKDDKRIKATAAANTFELVAREFQAGKVAAWSPSYFEKWLRQLEKDVFPYVGKLPIANITTPMMLEVIRRIEKRGVHDTAHTVKQTSGQVFRYGIQTGRCERDPCLDLTGALKPVIVKNMAAILDPVKVGGMLRAIDGYTGQPTTQAALILSSLLFQRPSNIRLMEWSWVDFDNAMLTVPSMSMKRRVMEKINGKPHLIPLAPQAVAALRSVQPLTGSGKYVFSSLLSGNRPMSENTVNTALRRMGYTSDDMTAHGFRAIAKTLILERLPGIDQGCVEAQMGHTKSGPLGSAYDRAEYMEQRHAMMRVWADYLDKLRVGAEVIQFKAATA
jgi:integrase